MDQNIYTSTYRAVPTVPTKTKVGDVMTKIGIVSGTISALFVVITLYCIIQMFAIQKREQLDELMQTRAELAKQFSAQIAETKRQSSR